MQVSAILSQYFNAPHRIPLRQSDQPWESGGPVAKLFDCGFLPRRIPQDAIESRPVSKKHFGVLHWKVQALQVLGEDERLFQLRMIRDGVVTDIFDPRRFAKADRNQQIEQVSDTLDGLCRFVMSLPGFLDLGQGRISKTTQTTEGLGSFFEPRLDLLPEDRRCSALSRIRYQDVQCLVDNPDPGQ